MTLVNSILLDLDTFCEEYSRESDKFPPGKRLSAWILASSCLEDDANRKWQHILLSYLQFTMFGANNKGEYPNKDGKVDDFFLECIKDGSNFMTFAVEVLKLYDKPEFRRGVDEVGMVTQLGGQTVAIQKAIKNIFSVDQQGCPGLRSLLASEKMSWDAFILLHTDESRQNTLVEECLRGWVTSLLPSVMERPLEQYEIVPVPPSPMNNRGVNVPAGFELIVVTEPGPFENNLTDVDEGVMKIALTQAPRLLAKDTRVILYGTHFMFMVVKELYWKGKGTKVIWQKNSNYKIGIDKVLAICRSLVDENEFQIRVRWKGLVFCGGGGPLKGNFSPTHPGVNVFAEHTIHGGKHLGIDYDKDSNIEYSLKLKANNTSTAIKAIQFEDEWVKMDMQKLLSLDAILQVMLLSFFGIILVVHYVLTYHS